MIEGYAFGRKPIPVGYTRSTEGRPPDPVDSPEGKASELLLTLQRLLLTTSMADTMKGAVGS